MLKTITLNFMDKQMLATQLCNSHLLWIKGHSPFWKNWSTEFNCIRMKLKCLWRPKLMILVTTSYILF